MPDHLPRERVEFDLSEAEKACPCCGKPWVRIGAETSEQLDYRSASQFAGGDAGGKASAVLYSVVGLCRRIGLDPFAYLRDVLERLPAVPADRRDRLLPVHHGSDSG